VLPHGKSLSIEVINQAGNSDWIWNIISDVAGSIEYKPDPAVEAGARLVSAVKAGGLKSYMQKLPQGRYYIFRSENDSAAGFSVSMWGNVKSQQQLNLRLIDSYYVNEFGGEEVILQTREDLSQWVWIGNVLGGSGNRTGRVESYLNVSGQMVTHGKGTRRVLACSPGDAAIPEPAIDAVMAQMALLGISAANIELISVDGKISPVSLKLDKSQANDSAYTVTQEFLDGSKTVQVYTLNKKLEVTRSVVKGRNNFVIESSTRQKVLEEFSMFYDYIDGLDELLRNDINVEQPRRTDDDSTI
jgi:hypothetical protein